MTAQDITQLFDNWIWNLAANLVAPIVDGGRRAAEVRRGKYALQDALAAYSQAVIGAIREVEDAKVRERRQSEHLKVQNERLAFPAMAPLIDMAAGPGSRAGPQCSGHNHIKPKYDR